MTKSLEKMYISRVKLRRHEEYTVRKDAICRVLKSEIFLLSERQKIKCQWRF